MKKLMKRIGAVLMAVAMMAALGVSAWAAGTNTRTKDATISVSGLEDGDTVSFYRVLKFDQNATTTGGWSADTGFTDLTDENIQKMLSLDSDGKPVTITDANKSLYGIDETLAATIADMAEMASVKYDSTTTPAVTISSGVASVAAPDDGLYVAIIHPGKAGVVYNPVFVGADYTSSNNTYNWTVDLKDSYSPASMAKKGSVTLDKTASTTEASYEDSKPETVAAGDTVNFTVDTTIPEFANNYTAARFIISDAVSTGLEYQEDAKVYIVSTVEGQETETELTGEAATAAFTNTTTTKTEDTKTIKTGYKIDFKSAWLLGREAATKIRVKYTAKVTSDAPKSVNILDNTVTVNYSNSPTDTDGKGALKDQTKHYTFDIDADLLGEESYHASEVVKVGIDKNGKEITEKRDLSNGHSVGALQGATFKLYVADTNGSNTIKDDTGADLKASVYTNDIMDANTVIISDGDGRLTIQGQTTPGIRGLDAGTYYLVEETAPDGYIKAQKAVKIEIIATIDENNSVTEYFDADGKFYAEQNQDQTRVAVTYKVPILTSYEVKINGNQTANYTMRNEKPDRGDTVVGADGLIGAEGAGNAAAVGKIQNIQGVELPSTGGIGTYVFTVAGVAIMAIAAGLLIVRHKKKAE